MRVIEHNHFSPKPASNRPPTALEHAISTAASFGAPASGPASFPVLSSVSPPNTPLLQHSTSDKLSKNIASLFAFTRKSQNNHRKWLRPPTQTLWHTSA